MSNPQVPDSPEHLSERAGRELWDRYAPWWKSTFTDGADVEYEEEILPLVASELSGYSRVLEIGCGEGQVARRLAHAGARQVIGLDPSSGQLSFARTAPHEKVRYVQGAGEALPFSSHSIDAVLCCLSIEHANDVDAVLGEVARVLRQGGRFLLLVNHPMFQGPGSGFVDDEILGEHYWRVGPYLDEVVTLEQVDSMVKIPFAHRPLSRYVNPLSELGLLMTKMFEPKPPVDFLSNSIDPALEGAIPRLLAMRFEHGPKQRC